MELRGHKSKIYIRVREKSQSSTRQKYHRADFFFVFFSDLVIHVVGKENGALSEVDVYGTYVYKELRMRAGCRRHTCPGKG